MPARGSIAGAYADVARNRSLRHTLLAFLVFSAQEYAVWIAVTLYAFARGGAGTAGAVAALQLVPAAIVAPLAAALGDRMRRDRALSLGYSAQAVASVALGVALWRAPAGVAYAMAVVSA